MTSLGGVIFALFVALILHVVVLSRIRVLAGADVAFLSRIYGATFALRLALAVFLNAFSGDSSFAGLFWGDSSQYDTGGYLLARVWGGDVLVNPYATKPVSGYGFFYFVGALYYVFGRNQLLVQVLNATIGSLAVLVLYAIGKLMFGREVGRLAATFMAFFPAMIFWSGGMYKDPAIILCISVSMYAVLRLREAFSARWLLAFVLASLILITLRFYIFYFVAFATLGTFLFTQRRGAAASFLSYAVFAAVFVGAFTVAIGRENVEQQAVYLDFQRLQLSRLDLARSASSGFAAEADVSTPEGALKVIPTGVVYLMFSPFPWAIRGLRQTLTLPEMLVWYALMPSLVRGLASAIRRRFRLALPILVFAASLTVAYSVFQGNVGTAYRQRTQITMFYFIFIALGIVERRQRRGVAARDEAAESPGPGLVTSAAGG